MPKTWTKETRDSGSQKGMKSLLPPPSPMSNLLLLLLYHLLLLVLPYMPSSHAQQPYIDNTQLDCYADAHYETSTLGYACNGADSSCAAYLLFRSQTDYHSPDQIARLLAADSSAISAFNPLPAALNDPVLVPVKCSCDATGEGIYRYNHNASYTLRFAGETYLLVANDTYQGLSTCQALMANNPAYPSRSLTVGLRIAVPLRCACPTQRQIDAGARYLLTYLVTWGDDIPSIARRFNVSEESVLDANGLPADQTIYPFTTLLVPLTAPLSKAAVAAARNGTAPNLQEQSLEKRRRGTNPIAVVIGVILGVLVLTLVGCVIFWRKKRKGKDSVHKDYEITKQEVLDLPMFDLKTIRAATDNFSIENKLGEGGYGPVYKGKLGEEQDIAVKRLSKTSIQGAYEFKNEVILITRLQHRNLVRLLGCCIQEEEKILVYEYMPNKSLDSFLFDKTNSALAEWQTRYNIILGIARGLLYLHQDSRFRIVHRDLKASNILLDEVMSPKISDFGMARIFGGDENGTSTRRVVGTYGYMSPEYIMDGIFSVKSDVFSFGVLLLEIISGKRNRGLEFSELYGNLLGYAWSFRSEGRALELVDRSMECSFHTTKVLRCINIGLLCVQERPKDRPTMSSVVLMLGSDDVSLPHPKRPGFVLIGASSESSNSTKKSCTINDVTITMLDGR